MLDDIAGWAGAAGERNWSVGNARIRVIAGVLPVLAVTLAMALPTLWYPYGRDQGQYAYFARQWRDGNAPYRDLWDQKPPGFYLIIMLLQEMLGTGMHVQRVGDLAAAAGIALLLWLLARRLGGSIARGAGLAAACCFPIVYFGGFIYWDTAQPEIWLSLFATAAVVSITGPPSLPRTALSFGLLAAAVLVKLPAAVLAPFLAVMLWLRLAERPPMLLAKHLGAAAGGMLGPAVAVAALVLRHHDAWRNMVEILLRYNAYYVMAKAGEVTMLDLVWQPLSFQLEAPATVLLYLLGLAVGVRLLSRTAWRTVLLWCAGSFLVLLVQKKYYLYHYVVLLPPVCYLVGLGVAWLGFLLHRFAAGGGSDLGRAGRRATAGLSAAGLCLLFTWGQVRPFYTGYLDRWWDLVSGRMGHFRFYSQFGGPDGYEYISNSMIARFLRWNAGPADFLAVQGFEPALYELTGLSCPSRFYSTFPLMDPKLSAFRPEWRHEYRTSLSQSHPRWIVTAGAPPLWLPDLYRKVEAHHRLEVWMATAPDAPPPVLRRLGDAPPPHVRHMVE
ncbi:hypothetical protein JW905_16520 [bacterium]|nr:hypothetical protein [candidate division CSSED10-310 bacterium]